MAWSQSIHPHTLRTEPFRDRQIVAGIRSTGFQPLLLLVIFLFFFLFSVTFRLRFLLLVLLLRFRLVLHTGVLFFRGHSSRTWFASSKVGWSSGAVLESFLPAAALAMMVFLKKFFVITLTLPVFTPIRILPMKTHPVLRLSLIPRQPSRRIPCSGSYNIVGSISIIWSPTVIRAVKIVQDAIQKPITVVIDPRRIRPHPG